ncbi:energy-coupled thiamine transporter ThiT [Ligilactobacillus pobuzihii]|uniref:energy-coupled thiamine transporter ThiT n=1 Tax=Ligilactobacillus pobuzihii TaxID=449659 RepID=UPI0019D28843|nr:energy-coupled thiamine transporter ThiT [Ligilactobacillus pobuzihii]MBN7274851.1 energy-coupled thiamine transporter ThiT [Ligilactobacillus pobuzihii]
MSQTKNSTRLLTETAIMSALSIVLSYIVIFRMPQGGSVSLVLLPLIFLGLRRGPVWACTAGAICGVVQLMFGGYFLNPLQVIFDYVLSFGTVGFAGFFAKPLQGALQEKNQGKIFGYTLAASFLGGFMAYLNNVISGIVFYAEYTPKGQSVFAYSTIYNATYMIPEALASMVIVWLLAVRAPKLFLPDK